MSDNILKKEIYRVNFSKNVEIDKLLNLNKIFEYSFEKSDLNINGFNINKKDRYFFINKGRFFNDDKLNNVFQNIINNKEYHFLLEKYKDLFHNINNKQQIITSSNTRLIEYLYYDLIINIEIAAYKHQLKIDNTIEKKAINKIIGKNINYSESRDKKQSKQYSRSNIALRSKNSVFYNKIEKSKNIPKSIEKECEKMGMNEIEFPQKYNKNKTLSLLKEINFIIDTIELHNRAFDLRFKKIAHYKKVGLYIKNAQCLIVDPRNTSSLFHELGHFIYETKSNFIIDDKKIDFNHMKNIVMNNEYKYEDKINNHKIEDSNKNSEVFAYYFEDKIQEIFKNNNKKA